MASRSSFMGWRPTPVPCTSSLVSWPPPSIFRRDSSLRPPVSFHGGSLWKTAGTPGLLLSASGIGPVQPLCRTSSLHATEFQSCITIASFCSCTDCSAATQRSLASGSMTPGQTW